MIGRGRKPLSFISLNTTAMIVTTSITVPQHEMLSLLWESVRLKNEQAMSLDKMPDAQLIQVGNDIAVEFTFEHEKAL